MLLISLQCVGVCICHCFCLRVCIYIYLCSCTHVCSADSLVVDFIMSVAGAAFLLSLLSVKYLLSTKTVNLSNGNKELRPKFLSTSEASQSCQKMPCMGRTYNIWLFAVLHFEGIGAEEKNLSCERKSGKHFQSQCPPQILWKVTKSSFYRVSFEKGGQSVSQKEVEASFSTLRSKVAQRSNLYIAARPRLRKSATLQRCGILHCTLSRKTTRHHHNHFFIKVLWRRKTSTSEKFHLRRIVQENPFVQFEIHVRLWTSQWSSQV